MVVIHGESNSGKSKKALSLIDISKKTVYFALDFDKNAIETYNENFIIGQPCEEKMKKKEEVWN